MSAKMYAWEEDIRNNGNMLLGNNGWENNLNVLADKLRTTYFPNAYEYLTSKCVNSNYNVMDDDVWGIGN